MSSIGASTARSPRPCASGGSLLLLVDAVAALLLAADLLVVSLSVISRYVLAAPVEWADDVARGLMVALSFFGAAGALARNENAGVAFFVQSLLPRAAPAASTPWRLLVGARDRRLGRLERDGARALTTGPDHRLRPAARMDLLSDGRRRVCMTVFALAQLLPPARAGYCVRRC